MAIQRIEIENFRSFGKVNIELGAFNVLVGPNASGKSNFVQALRFVRDIAKFGLSNAMSLQGGMEYARNYFNRSERAFRIGLVLDGFEFGLLAKQGVIQARTKTITYTITVEAGAKGTFKLRDERLLLPCLFFEIAPQVSRRVPVGEGDILLQIKDGEIRTEVAMSEHSRLSGADLLFRSSSEPIESRTSLLEASLRPISRYSSILPFVAPSLETLIGGLGIFDFDPKLSKHASAISGREDLEEDGRNLAIVLQDVLENNAKRREMLLLMRDLLPFVHDLAVEDVADKSVLINLRENYSRSYQVPSTFMSDGTIHSVALILALFFTDQSTVVIEEPERNMHPHLIARLVDYLREAATRRQVIVTTHSPEVVKCAGIENLLLVTRDAHGYSSLLKPSNDEFVRNFLQNDVGLDELFVQNLLGA